MRDLLAPISLYDIVLSWSKLFHTAWRVSCQAARVQGSCPSHMQGSGPTCMCPPSHPACLPGYVQTRTCMSSMGNSSTTTTPSLRSKPHSPRSGATPLRSIFLKKKVRDLQAKWMTSLPPKRRAPFIYYQHPIQAHTPWIHQAKTLVGARKKHQEFNVSLLVHRLFSTS